MQIAINDRHNAFSAVSRRAVKSSDSNAVEQVREEKDGVTVIQLAMSDLFGKPGAISSQLDGPVKNIQGLEVTISLATPLIPEQIKRELNPLTITIVKATGLPDKPISQEELKRK